MEDGAFLLVGGDIIDFKGDDHDAGQTGYQVWVYWWNGVEGKGAKTKKYQIDIRSCEAQTVSVFMTKDADDLTPYDAVGYAINYTITMENTGSVDINTPNVQDDLADIGPTYVSGDNGNDDILGTGEAWTYSATHIVTQQDIDDGIVLNTAIGSGSPANGADNISPEDSESVYATQSPELTVTKNVKASTYVAVDDVLHYTIAV